MTGLWTTWGPIREGCGHWHGTADAAQRCADDDQARRRRIGGMSDRQIRPCGSRQEAYSLTLLGRAAREFQERIARG